MQVDPSGSLIDELTDRLIRGLHDAMHAADARTVSILVDPTLADLLADDAHVRDALALGRVERLALPWIHDDIDVEVAPYLLHIGNAVRAERAISASVAAAAYEALEGMSNPGLGRSVCAWIVGDPSAQVLARRLRDAARIVRPDGRLWPLRYWDPRVLWHLEARLPQSHWRVLQARLGQWWALDPCHRLVAYGNPRATTTAGEEAMRVDPLVWDRLARIGSINAMLRIAWEWDVLPTAANADRIERLIVRCEALGFTAEQDALVFAACGLTSHDRFDDHPHVAAALRRAAAEGESVQSALEPFSDQFWSELAPGHWFEPSHAEIL